MAVGKLDHIDLSVDDLEKTAEYLIKKLGFKLLRETEHSGKSYELGSPAGDFFIELHQYSEEAAKMGNNRSGGCGDSCHFCHIAFKVDDINSEYEDLKSKGVSFTPDRLMYNPTNGRTLASSGDDEAHFWQLTD